MSTAVLHEPDAGASPQPRPRLAGFFYLLTFLTGAVAAFASSRLLVSGNAAATAANLLAHPSLARLNFAAYVLNVVVYLAVTLLFYELFKPAHQPLALLAVFFSLMGCAIQATASVFLLAPLIILGNAAYLRVFSADQLQAIALLALRLHAQAYNIGLVFFGIYCLLIGTLILRATFLPRILGGLMVCAGFAWLTFLWPPLATALAPGTQAVGVLGEGSLTLWLLIRGVHVQRWQQQTSNAI